MPTSARQVLLAAGHVDIEDARRQAAGRRRHCAASPRASSQAAYAYRTRVGAPATAAAAATVTTPGSTVVVVAVKSATTARTHEPCTSSSNPSN